ncbi:MAG: CcdB family protein [Pikeienuella sp.]
MARYDVYANPDASGYLLDVQADLLDSLNTRVVVPLMPISAAPSPAKRLNPVFNIQSEPHVMAS